MREGVCGCARGRELGRLSLTLGEGHDLDREADGEEARDERGRGGRERGVVELGQGAAVADDPLG